MCRRNNLVHRRVTSVGQKVKKKAVEIAKQFLEDMKNVNLQILQTWMKLRVTLIFLDLQLLIKNGVQTVKVKTTGAECLHFTLALTAGVKKTENGFTPFRLTPLLIFKNLVKAPPGKYPAGMADLGLKTGGGRAGGGGGVGNEMFHDERNLREMYLQKKARWVFQYRKIHFINGLS